MSSSHEHLLNSIDAAWLQRFRRQLRRWYAHHGRDLPWRRTSDPYRIWISEIMLQQTTVQAVVPYFERFLSRFPTIDALAAAPEEDVLRAWEGLGYYSRARNIHKTARRLVAEAEGQFPTEVEKLQELPGIGRYTAGAIVSFAFDRPAPIVEANTLRLYSRLLGFRGDPRSSAGQRLLWRFAEQLVPNRKPGAFNQALMELGSAVCTPTTPECSACPVRTGCQAFEEGAQTEIPQAAQRPVITQVTEVSVAVRRGDRYLLRRRGEGERWAGLWDFPRFEWPAELAEMENGAGPLVPLLPESRTAQNGQDRQKSLFIQQLPLRIRRQLEQELAARTGIRAKIRSLLTEIRHSVTRYRIRLLCFVADYESGEHFSNGTAPLAEHAWVRSDQFADYPLSVTGRRFAELLSERDTVEPE